MSAGAGAGTGVGATPGGNLLFDGLPAEDIATLTADLPRIRLASGDVLFTQGDTGSSLFLVLSGMMRIFAYRDAREITIRAFLPGTYFGELALLGQEQRSASARAVEPTELLEIDSDALARLISSHPQITLNLGRVLAGQLVATTQTLVDVQRGELVLVAVAGYQRLTATLRYALEAASAMTRGPMAALTPRGVVPGADSVVSAVRTDHRPDRSARQAQEPSLSAFTFRRGTLLGSAAMADATGVMCDYFRRWWTRTVVVISEEEREWFALAAPQVDRIILLGEPETFTQWPSAGDTPVEVVPLQPDTRPRRRVIEAVSAAGFGRPGMVLSDARTLEQFSSGGFDPAHLTDVRLAQQHGLLRFARALAKTRVGVALGAGGARGMAHIGTLRRLEELGIPIDAYSGTSMGAMVAGVFARGMSSLDAESYLLNWLRTGHRKMMRPAFSRHSILSGKVIENTCRDLFGDLTFNDLHTPFIAVAADLLTGRGVQLQNGSLVRSVQASMSIPGLFPPIVIEPWILVDGGVCDPVPSGSLAGMHADVRLACNISYSPEDVERWAAEEGVPVPRRTTPDNKLPNVVDTYLASFGIAVAERAAISSVDAEVTFRPRFVVTSWREFQAAPDHLLRGYAAVGRTEDELRQVLPWVFRRG